MSVIGDFFNRIRNRRLPQGVESQKETEYIGQYDYSQVMDYMQQIGGMDEFFYEYEKIKSEQEKYYPSNVHGISHTSRVTLLATILANLDNLDSHTKDLLLAAARYHDVGRIDDRESKEHGGYSSDKIEDEDLLKGYSREDKKKIKFVIEQHSLSKEENEKAIQKLPFWKRESYSELLSYLKDADALDRVRIANENAKLDPNRLRHTTAKQLVNFSYDNYRKFNGVLFDYEQREGLMTINSDPILNECYELIKDSMTNYDWIIENREFLVQSYNKGILQNAKKDDINFLDIIEDEKLMQATGQVQYGDFEYLRGKGYNITYQTFLDVASEYKDGTLDFLRANGKLEDMFSYDTLKKYGKEESFDERLKGNNINRDNLLNKLNEKAYVELTEESLDRNYVLYRNLYKKHKDSFNILVNSGIDVSFESICGILEKFEINDLNKIRQSGYKLSIKDLITIGSKFTPEEYRNIIDSKDVGALVRYDQSKDPNGREYNYTFNVIRSMNPEISEKDFFENYELYKEISRANFNVYASPKMKKFDIKEIYPAFTRIIEAEERIEVLQNGERLNYDSEVLANFLEFSQKTKILDSTNEEEKDSIIKILIKSGEWKDDPRLIEYVTKKNKEFFPDKVEDVFDYNRYCCERILQKDIFPDGTLKNLRPKSSVTLKEAKSLLINSLFEIEAPNGDYKEEIENNVIDELYYYRKYRDEQTNGVENNPVEKEMNDVIDYLIKIMDSKSVQEFKENLSEIYKDLSNYKCDTIFDVVKDRMMDISKKDVVQELQNTKDMLDKQEPTMVQINGENIPVKRLAGEKFVLAVTTSMPKCSSVNRKLNHDEQKIKENMLTRPLNPNNRCTSLVDDSMIAHAKSALTDEELVYAYIPRNRK